MLSDARSRLRRDIRSVFFNTSCRIREAGLDAAGAVNSGENAEDIEAKLSDKIEEANVAATDCQQEAQEILRKGLSEVEQDISEAENSAFSMELKTRLETSIGTLPENIRNLLVNAGGFMKGVGDLLVQNAVNPEGAGIKLACYSGSNVQKAVLDIGKAFNVKFKPWQTEKIARGFARAGSAESSKNSKTMSARSSSTSRESWSISAEALSRNSLTTRSEKPYPSSTTRSRSSVPPTPVKTRSHRSSGRF